MLCNYPFYFKYKKNGIEKRLLLPCNNCKGCKIAHSREWAFRILCEFTSMRGQGAFITLTYNEENNPVTLVKEDFQKFIKRLRKDIDYKIKYFACGEYGENTNRPHYHAIILGLLSEDFKLIEQNWPYGFVQVGTVTYESCKYVTGYIDKKYGVKKNQEVYLDNGLLPPFQLVSQGLGLDFFKQLDPNTLTLHGNKISVPRYFIDKLQLQKVGTNSFRKFLKKIELFQEETNQTASELVKAFQEVNERRERDIMQYKKNRYTNL